MAHQGAGVKELTFCTSQVAVGEFSPEKSADGRYMIGISRARHADASGVGDLPCLRSAFIVTPHHRKGTRESPDKVSHGRDATVSGRSVREGTNKGTPDRRSAMGTHDLRVVPSQ